MRPFRRLPHRSAGAGAGAVVVVVAALSVAAPPARAGTPSPADWRDVSIYQIMTDRFFNGDPSNDAVEGHFDPADGFRNHGGDWAGIERKLDYIAGLGATAIWISPVQTNAYAAYHGYHIRDFHSFAAHFGGLPALTSLIDAAHARGIYVILDVIANHGGDLIDSGDAGYPSFQDPGTYTLRWRDPPNYPAPPFDQLGMYHNNGAIQDFVDPDQILGELANLDDFRTEDPTVRANLIAAHQWLIEQTDADGFRIDTVKHVELDFWQEFGPQIHSFAADSLGKDDFFLFGEIFDGSAATNGKYTGTVAGGPFALDAVLWYPMYFASRDVFRYGAPTSWLSNVLSDSTEYEPTATGRNVNFLDNHDNGRFMGFGSGADRDDAKARAALTWNHTSTGIPLVYYGMEQEFDGGGDPYNREDMWDGEWDFGPSEGDHFDMASPLYRHVRRLNELRAALLALRRGAQEDIASDAFGAGLYAFYRRLPGEATVLVVINTDTSSRTLNLDPDFPAGTIVDGISGRTVEVPAAGPIGLEIGGITAAVFTAAEVPAAPWVAETWPPHDRWLRSPDGEIRIAFTQPMNHASVEAAITIDPAIAVTPQWIGSTLALRPAGAIGIGRYRVTIDGSATNADGVKLGAAFSWEFDRAAPIVGFTAPAGFGVAVNTGTDAPDPLSLARGGAGTIDEGRLLLGDNSWRRVFDVSASGFVEACVVDGDITRPSSMACDAAAGVFDGDWLLADTSTLRRIRRDGALGGSVEPFAAFPASVPDWIVAVDGSGTLGGDAFAGHAGDGTLWRIDGAGVRTAQAAGLSGVRGLASASGGAFGAGFYVLESGAVKRVEPGGALTTVASSSLLTGASGLAIDPTGAFGSAMFTVRSPSGSIVRIEANGAVTAFATGFTGFPAGNCLAFDRLGNLAVVENAGSIHRIVTIVADNSDSVVTESPLPVTGSGITRVGPNPFREVTRVDFVVPDDGVGEVPVRLSIHDVAGRRVATILDASLPPGAHEGSWNGRDRTGRSVAPGVYFARLKVGPRESTAKVVRAP